MRTSGVNLRCRTAVASLLAAVALLAGCADTTAPQFTLNLEGRVPDSVKPEQAQAIGQMLEHLFGTPDAPRVPSGVTLNLERLALAAGPAGHDAQGHACGLYRKLCVTCHGVNGDGAGPTAATLDPYPRDYRTGTFKYTSTLGGARPVTADLRRTLLQGVPGTAMPAQTQLQSEQLDALVEYVKYLSLRGQTELYLLQLVVDEDAFLPLSESEVRDEGVLPAAALWAKAESQILHPVAPPSNTTPEQMAAAVARGRAVYLKKEAQCVKCHGQEGRGDGEQQDLYDDWNKVKVGLTPAETAALAPRFRLPAQRLRARDFREGVFHGGSRPEDLYLRIHLGIKGTPMPPVGPAPGIPGILTAEEIWYLVTYIRHLGRVQ